MNIECASRRASRGVLTVLACLFASVAVAAVPIHVVKTDLKPGIRAGMRSPVQFAVLVPQNVSTASDGDWSMTGDRATWSYAVQVPTAVSLSFHAAGVLLPPSATLVVRGARTTTSYVARDVHARELWSRIHPGDALQITLSVATADRNKVRLDIVSLQAGYRSLGAGVADHPYYRQLKAEQAAAVDNTSCVTNFECKITAANTPAGSATMALVVEGLYQCTGTLINDVPGDNTPYVLTARHCETGQVAAPGKPSAAAGTTFYWNATTSCGAALGTIYDPGIPAQTGAQTVVEQQDMWLIRLDSSPVISDAQFAGFDASGGAVQGGYSIHHAEGNDKQFTAWFGQPSKVQLNANLKPYLETVNQTGNIGPGASGSALVDQNNHLVGSLTYGRVTSDPSGYGSCPLPSPPAPDGTNGVADFTSLAALWTVNDDPNSTTGTTTLKSVLDPENTDTLIVASAPALTIAFTTPVEVVLLTTQVALNWSALNASQCTASGGTVGDGWAGTLGASGTQNVTETTQGVVTYTLTCAFAGGRSARASVAITWVGPAPEAELTAPSHVWTTRPVVLSWSSNAAPCTISGGSVSLTNQAASGSTTTTQATPGDVTYTLICGPAINAATRTTLVSYVTPSLLMEANGTDRRMNEVFFIAWVTYADTCVPSGGAPNDGWSGTAFPTGGPGQFSPGVNVPGTYTYALSCSSGPITEQQSVTVTFENDAPYVTESADKTSVVYSNSPAGYVMLSWNSNLSTCSPFSSPYIPFITDDPITGATLAQGSVTFSPPASGVYMLSTGCGSSIGSTSVISTPITLTVLPPPAPTATISMSPDPVVLGQNFTITWSSTNASECITTGPGSLPGSFWLPGGQIPAAGQTTGEFTSEVQATIGITCPSIDPNQSAASATVLMKVLGPNVTLTTSATSVTTGSPFTLTWSSSATSSCSALGGDLTGSWSGSLATSGSKTLMAGGTGSFVYTVQCTGEGETVSADVTITMLAPSGGSSGGGAGGGGGGGGGAIGALELSLLGAWQLLRRRRAAPAARRSAA